MPNPTAGKEKGDDGNSQVNESARRPEVILEVLFDRGLLSLCVRNIGDGAAYQVSMTFDQKLVGLGGDKDISSLAVFKNIELLGPNREIAVLLDTSHSYFARKQPEQISVEIRYQDSQRRNYETVIKHNLGIYRDLPYSTSNPACCD